MKIGQVMNDLGFLLVSNTRRYFQKRRIEKNQFKDSVNNRKQLYISYIKTDRSFRLQILLSFRICGCKISNVKNSSIILHLKLSKWSKIAKNTVKI